MNFSIKNKIPPQKEGRQSDIVEKRTASDNTAAMQLFRAATMKLLDINAWEIICEGLSASFALTDKNGNPVHSAPEEGFFIRIDIPGPTAGSGRGYDWVQIEKIEQVHDLSYATAHTLMRVRPCADPAQPGHHAHFFNAKATSTFIVRKDALVVSAEVHGRNEEAALDDSVMDNIRNKLVSAAATAGMAAIQWEKLVKGLLGKTAASRFK